MVKEAGLSASLIVSPASTSRRKSAGTDTRPLASIRWVTSPLNASNNARFPLPLDSGSHPSRFATQLGGAAGKATRENSPMRNPPSDQTRQARRTVASKQRVGRSTLSISTAGSREFLPNYGNRCHHRNNSGKFWLIYPPTTKYSMIIQNFSRY